ncbi:hypothetical protein [Limosilactobacillus reuteri]|uniref:hypothetical protein n=1 Tax=Limosilactobacillus reuteri TaxID=1598 RepID=UPI001E427442|nr:hypothetical protein [Limosilactobacillus reuteri]MCC4467716.1 hypothetical protein [Limosilactobacillus reuteri]MCC4473754.1 hypothetical protein [Limosilactobacillus reuteri]
MKKSDYEQFKSIYSQNRTWYKGVKSGESISLNLIDEQYEVKASYNSKCEGAILFRIEDYKSASGLLCNKRKGPKDNDLTILGDDIYQVEIKDIKKAKAASIPQQFKDGLTWVNHIIWVSDPKNNLSLKRIYNVCVKIKDYSNVRSRSRNNNLTVRNPKPEDMYLTVIWKRTKDEKLKLNTLIERVLSKNLYFNISELK